MIRFGLLFNTQICIANTGFGNEAVDPPYYIFFIKIRF